MKSKSFEYRAFLYIRKARFAKKLKIYKQVAAVVFDWTSFIYVVALLGYIGISMFVTGDIMQEFAPYFVLMEENAGRGYALLISVLPIRYVLQSFRQPGVLYSTSEFQLGVLPFRRGKIWILLLVEKMIKLLLILTVVGMLLILITPIPNGLIISYLALFAIYELVMAVPKWKLFQQRFWAKAGWLLIVIFGCLAASLLESGLIVLSIIVLSHIVLIPCMFKKVKWEKVTDISDYYIWNMMVVSAASKTKFKKKKTYSIFQNSARRKRAFLTDSAVYHRLWQLYFVKNLGVIAQVIGAILLMLIVVQFLDTWIFYLAIAVAVYFYASLCANLFHNRFSADVVEVLPWNLQGYKRAFLKWMAIGGTLLMLPVVIYFILHWNIWALIKLFLIMAVFLYTYHVKMDRTIILLGKKSRSIQLREGLSFLFVILIVVSYFLPVASLASIGVGLLLYKDRKERGKQ